MVILLLAAMSLQQDTSLLATAAAQGRAYATAHAVGANPRGPTATQYRAALALIDSGKWDDASVRLQAVSRIDARNPVVKGDLGYVQAHLEHWSDAGNAYQAASGLQPENPWYYVGLGIARGGEGRDIEAAGMFALAAHTDSVVISPAFVTAIVDAYERAGRTSNQLDWFRIATTRYPEQPIWWLKLAQALHEADDTTNGLAAARRYNQMRPNEPVGMATLATYLLDIGKADSAADIASRLATSDTTYRAFAVTILWGVGTRAFRAHDYAKASTVLKQGMALANHEMLPRFAYYAAHADLQRAVALGQASSETRDCSAAQASDSLASLAEENFRRAVSVDSTNVTNTLTTTIPQVHQQVANLKRAYCTGATQAQPPRGRRP